MNDCSPQAWHWSINAWINIVHVRQPGVRPIRIRGAEQTAVFFNVINRLAFNG